MNSFRFDPNYSQELLISVIVIFNNMPQEAIQTLYTLTPRYQKFQQNFYEVLIVDNGATMSLHEKEVCSMSENFRYIYYNNVINSSLVSVLNYGIQKSRGKIIGLMIDGTGMLTPGVLNYTYKAFHSFENPLVTLLGLNIKIKNKIFSGNEDSNQIQVDRLLESINWRENGYELFKISSNIETSTFGYFSPIINCACFFINASLFNELKGFEEFFDSPKNELLDYGICILASILPKVELVQILGEGSFRQFHTGKTTKLKREKLKIELFKLNVQYHELLGLDFENLVKNWHFIGHFPKLLIELIDNSSLGLGDFLTSHATDEKSNLNAGFTISDSNLEKFTARTIIILGMHRSGTSMLTGSLQEAGLALGDVVEHAPFNLKGNREHPSIMNMHENLLFMNGGSWSDPPAVVNWGKIHESIRDLFIHSFKYEEVWGFKDPRTLFTIEGWLEVLEKPEIVGIFRNPLSVAFSLKKRNNFALEKGLELWKKYNMKLLCLHDKYNFPLIEFHSSSFILKEKLKVLINDLKLPARHRELTFFDHRLQSDLSINIDLSDDIKWLYEELLNRAI